MNHHITLKLVDSEDFKQLVTVIEGSGFKLLSMDAHELEVECQLDNFILSLAEKYLDAVIVYHNNSAIKMQDNLAIKMQDKIRSTVAFENMTG